MKQQFDECDPIKVQKKRREEQKSAAEPTLQRQADHIHIDVFCCQDKVEHIHIDDQCCKEQIKADLVEMEKKVQEDVRQIEQFVEAAIQLEQAG